MSSEGPYQIEMSNGTRTVTGPGLRITIDRGLTDDSVGQTKDALNLAYAAGLADGRAEPKPATTIEGFTIDDLCNRIDALSSRVFALERAVGEKASKE